MILRLSEIMRETKVYKYCKLYYCNKYKWYCKTLFHKNYNKENSYY